MYKLIYLQKALDDLDELHLHISQDNIKAAKDMIDRILSSIERLALFPFSGAPVRDKLGAEKDYRMLVVKPYLVFYRVEGNNVYINRVLHGKRYYPALL